jgi:hypothetical protein
MSDRWVFLVSFLTLVLTVAGAFVVPEFFVYQLLTSLIFLIIALLVFYGEDAFPFMLGMIAPILWWIFSALVGGLSADLKALFAYLGRKPIPPMETPLHGVALLMSLVLVCVSARAWRSQITQKFFGRTFGMALVVGLVWIGILAGWMSHTMSFHAWPH